MGNKALGLFILFGFLLLPLSLPTAQTPAPAQEKAPSLADTADWLKDKLTVYANYSKDKGQDIDLTKVEEVSFNGCTLSFKKIKKLTTEGFSTLDSQVTYTIVLGDLDPAKVKVETDKETNRGFISLYTVDEKKKIQLRVRSSVVGSYMDKSGLDSEVSILFRDAVVAERVAKAFAHAIQLCKGQKEPF